MGYNLFVGYREKTRPQLSKKDPHDNLQGEAESSSYPFFSWLTIVYCGERQWGANVDLFILFMLLVSY